jgi:hypothetical protein
MKRRIAMALMTLALLSACASRPDVYRSTALLLADEIHRGTVQWDAKIRDEQAYAEAVQKDAAADELLDIGNRKNIARTAKTNAFIDAEMLGRSAPSLSATQNFLLAMHDFQRDQADSRARRVDEAEKSSAVALEKVLFERDRLEALETAIRATASEKSAAIRDRRIREWGGRIKADYDAAKPQ